MARETFLVAGALDNFLPAGRRAYCLGASSSGAPPHPMARGRHRVPDDALPQPWDESPFYKTQAEKNAAGSDAPCAATTDERRVGKEGVRTCRSRGAPVH